MTLSEIIATLSPHKTVISEADEQYIVSFLESLGFKDEEGSKISIEELSKKNKVYVLLPKELYNKIDFTQFYLPHKLIININNHANTIIVYGEDELKDYSVINSKEFNLKKTHTSSKTGNNYRRMVSSNIVI